MTPCDPRYDVPEVMCRDTARRECSDMAFLSPVTTSHYIQTAKTSYEGTEYSKAKEKLRAYFPNICCVLQPASYTFHMC